MCFSLLFSSPAHRFLHLDRKWYFQANILDYKFFEKGNPDSTRAYTTEATKMWVLWAQNLVWETKDRTLLLFWLTLTYIYYSYIAVILSVDTHMCLHRETCLYPYKSFPYIYMFNCFHARGWNDLSISVTRKITPLTKSVNTKPVR